jgi:hypothetical protein
MLTSQKNMLKENNTDQISMKKMRNLFFIRPYKILAMQNPANQKLVIATARKITMLK